MSNIQNNKTKTWQIALFALNGISTNIAMMFMNYFMFFSQNILGLSAVTIGMIVTGMRMFDGITDPFVGILLDRCDTKFGKFRPFMVAGTVIMVICMVAMFNCPSDWSTGAKYAYMTAIYAVYILGYTFQTTVTRAAQAVLTSDPKQRPMFSVYNSAYNAILNTIIPLIIATWMAPKYKLAMVDPQLWKDAVLIFVGMMIVSTILAVIGIAGRDRKEFFGVSGEKQVVTFKDMYNTIKGNRALQMLVVAASTDKLAFQILNGVNVYLFANLFLSNAMQGKFASMKVLPVLVVSVGGISLARKYGMKIPFVVATWISMISLVAMYFIGATPDNMGLFLIVFTIQQSAVGITNNIQNPMIADCVDYERHRTGKFIPGTIGTLFTFVDKMISSLGTTFVGFALAAAGVANSVIPSDTFISDKFNSVVMICVCIVPIIGHIATIIAMKFYPLTKEKMEDIQEELKSQKVETA